MKRIIYWLLVTAILSSACLYAPPATTRTTEITVTPLRPAATVDSGAATFEAMVIASATALKLTASPVPSETSATPTAAEAGRLAYPLSAVSPSSDGAQAAQAALTEPPFTPIPPAPIMGYHVALKDETIYCIGRAYGVLPAAIAQANGLVPPFNMAPGQTLAIPEVQWMNVAAGPVCPPQFTSKFPGLSAVTPYPS